jgi:sugar lactone lactonase YvrE
MIRRSIVCGLGLVALASACEKNEKPGTTSTSAADPRETKPKAPPPETAAVTAPKPAEVRDLKKPAVAWKDIGLSTPESIVHDADADVYLVSNVDGQPLAKDGKAFISRLSPDGKVLELKWIESGQKGVKLDAPKGLAISGDNLFVADLDTVRIFDRKTGAPAGEVKVPGATMLNGICAGEGGRVVVSDTGMKAGKDGAFEEAGTDAVYAIAPDKKLSTIVKAKDLGHPNGLLVAKDKTWVVTFDGSGGIYALDAKGKKEDEKKLPKGQLDGIVAFGDEVLVSSWDAKAVYRGKPGGDFKVAVEEVAAPADIEIDAKRSRLLVPLFKDNEIRAYDLK